MRAVAVIAIAAESALGHGAEAYSVGHVGAAPHTKIALDPDLRDEGLAKPWVARTARRGAFEGDAAVGLLGRVTQDLVRDLDDVLPAWRNLRIGVIVGTSSGGLESLMGALSLRHRGQEVPRELARATPYFGPLAALDAALPVAPVVRVQVLAACASSGMAIGIGCRWLELNEADLVIAGGYDAVTTFVAAGFESLGATSGAPPAPFRRDREGMSLGEGAALFALSAVPAAATRVVGFVRGFGATSDAVHVTAPDREGRGLGRAALSALVDAGLDASAIDLVSAHATATRFNDAAEARALKRVFGARAFPVHPFKAVIGHTLGASSALEAAASLDALARGIFPAALGVGPIDPDVCFHLLSENAAGDPRHALKLSAAFGGANASLVLARDRVSGTPIVSSHVEVVAVGAAVTARDLSPVAHRTRMADVQLSRVDPLSGAAIAAVAGVLGRLAKLGLPELPLARTGVAMGTIAATLENDESFADGLRGRGAPGARPRRFPPTSPNVPPGQCSIAFGFLGPCFSVGAGPEAPIEALLVASDLLRAGDAEAMIVIAADHVGGVVQDLFAAAAWTPPVDGAAAAVLRRSSFAGFDRGRLTSALANFRLSNGFHGAARPGWPAFLAILEELRDARRG